MRYVRLRNMGFILGPRSTREDAPSHSAMVHNINDTPVSAGFVKRLPGGELECYGRSASLNLDSKPEDSLLLQTQLQELDYNG